MNRKALQTTGTAERYDLAPEARRTIRDTLLVALAALAVLSATIVTREILSEKLASGIRWEPPSVDYR